MANPKYTVSDRPVPVSELVDTLSDGTKVKRRVPRMRACNEKDEKGKLCAGHLKRWYFFGDEVKQKFGKRSGDLPLRTLQNAVPSQPGRVAPDRNPELLNLHRLQGTSKKRSNAILALLSCRDFSRRKTT